MGISCSIKNAVDPITSKSCTIFPTTNHCVGTRTKTYRKYPSMWKGRATAIWPDCPPTPSLLSSDSAWQVITMVAGLQKPLPGLKTSPKTCAEEVSNPQFFRTSCFKGILSPGDAIHGGSPHFQSGFHHERGDLVMGIFPPIQKCI